MPRHLMLVTLILATPAWGARPKAVDPERDWIRARNAEAPSPHYPAGFGLAPERLATFAPDPAWTFWNEDWADVARGWTRELYVALKLADQNLNRASQNELAYLETTLARLNLLANRVRDPLLAAPVAEAVGRVLIDGAATAAAQAGVAARMREPRFRDLLLELARASADDRRLKRGTREVAREWRRHDTGAHDQRAFQSFLGVGAMGYGAWALGTASTEHFFPAAFAGLAALVVANTAGSSILPFTGRFQWKENRVRGPMAECESALTAGRRST